MLALSIQLQTGENEYLQLFFQSGFTRRKG